MFAVWAMSQTGGSVKTRSLSDRPILGSVIFHRQWLWRYIAGENRRNNEFLLLLLCRFKCAMWALAKNAGSMPLGRSAKTQATAGSRICFFFFWRADASRPVSGLSTFLMEATKKKTRLIGWPEHHFKKSSNNTSRTRTSRVAEVSSSKECYTIKDKFC